MPVEDGDQIHLAGVLCVARWHPVEQHPEPTLLEQLGESGFDPPRLVASLPAASAEPPQVVDRSGAVVLHPEGTSKNHPDAGMMLAVSKV
jgi:hypothetical protein